LTGFDDVSRPTVGGFVLGGRDPCNPPRNLPVEVGLSHFDKYHRIGIFPYCMGFVFKIGAFAGYRVDTAPVDTKSKRAFSLVT